MVLLVLTDLANRIPFIIILLLSNFNRSHGTVQIVKQATTVERVSAIARCFPRLKKTKTFIDVLEEKR